MYSLRLLSLSLLTALSVLLCSCSRGPAYRNANVILVVIDTLRSDRLIAYGSGTRVSPTLDRLAEEGFCFLRTVAPSNWTKPSVASLMTGLYPGRHGAVGSLSFHSNLAHLEPDCVTLAEQLRDAGYRTAAFVTNPHLVPRYRFDQGFDEYHWPAKLAGKLFASAAKWIEDRDGPEPFFLYLHVVDPHSPYYPPPAFQRLHWAGDPDGGAPFTERGEPMEVVLWMEQYRLWRSAGGEGTFRFDHDEDWIRERMARIAPKLKVGDLPEMDLDFEGPDDPRFLKRIRHLKALYNAEVAYTDEALKGLLDLVRERGLLEKTILVVTSDHGEAFLEHRYWGHGNLVHGEEVDVPLIFRLPPEKGNFRGSSREMVSLVDVYPTVLDLVGLPVPAGLDGSSLRSLIQSPEADRPGPKPVFTEAYLEEGAYVAAVSDRGKVIRWTGREDGSGSFAYFDLKADPGEMQPMDPEDGGRDGLELKRSLESFLKTRSLDFNKKGEGGAPTPEEIQQLRELGYL